MFRIIPDAAGKPARREEEMVKIPEGLRIIEGFAFVAAALAGMTLAQIGADVICFDRIRGGLDKRPWPVTNKGRSLFRAGLNKGKRSLHHDLIASGPS